VADAEDAAHAADPAQARPNASWDDEGEELGRVGRILAIPLVPFVALWEAAKAGARGISSGARWLRSAGASVGRFVGRLVSAAARSVISPFRAGYRIVIRLGRCARAALARGWAAARAAAGAIARPVAAGARAVVQPVRALWRGLASLARRASVALRAAASAVAMPVRNAARAVVAIVKRWLVAVRAFAKGVAAGLRAGGRAVVALVRRVGVALRAAARAVAMPVRNAGRALVALVRRVGVPLRAAARMLTTPVRAVASALGTAARQAMEAARRLGAVIRSLAQRMASLVAAPVVGGAVLVVAGARLIAKGAKSIATSLLRLVRWIWRPVAGVGRQAREWFKAATGPIRRAVRTVGTRVRAAAASAGSKARAQWRRSREAAHRVRVAARRGLEDARLGVRRWARSIRRGNEARSRRDERRTETAGPRPVRGFVTAGRLPTSVSMRSSMPDPIFAHPRLAAIYDVVDDDRSDLDVYAALVEELGATSILDIGCGTGTFASRLARRGKEVVGLDPASAAIEVARRKPGAENVRWVQGDVSCLPALRVDLVTMTGNVAQVFLTDSEWTQVLLAARDALGTGGWLVFETRDPDRRAWERWTRDQTYRALEVPQVGIVETWVEVTAVALPYVSFRHTFLFGVDRTELTSASTLRFRARDHVDAVVTVVDAIPDPVVLVGHSGGGAIAHAVADARPERIARVVYVDSGPLGHGDAINDALPVVDGEVPLPDWSAFGEEDLVDLDDDLRERFRSIAIPEPVAVAKDTQVLGDDRRYDVPVTVITCEFPADRVRGLMAESHPYVAELAKIGDVEIVDLPTGHWPQLTRPRDLATAILAAVDR
jgi:SAM-dependent methyltransferase